MADSATPTSTDHVQPHSEGDRELARALALLEGDRAGSVTIAALRERAVKAPAQATYDLQLARLCNRPPHLHISRTRPRL